VFINDGEQVMTHRIQTDPSIDGISFRCDGTAVVDIEGYSLERNIVAESPSSLGWG